MKVAKAVFVTIFSMLNLCSASTGWNVDKIVSQKNFNGDFTSESIASDPDGNVYMVYGGDNLRLAVFDGMDWDYEVVDDTNGSGANPIILCDQNGNLRVLYDCQGTLRQAYRAYQAVSWSIEIVYPYSFTYISAVLDTNGAVHIAGIASNRHLIYLTDANGFWETSTAISGEYLSYGCSIAVNSLNEPVICLPMSYIIGVGGFGGPLTGDLGTNLVYRDGTSWIVQPIYALGWNFDRATLWLDHLDQPHVLALNYLSSVWSHQAISHYYYIGYTWLSQELENPAGVYIYPSIFQDDSGIIHVSYEGLEPNTVKYATLDGNTWNSQIVYSGDTKFKTALTLDADQNPVISAMTLYDQRLDAFFSDDGNWSQETVDQAYPPDYYFGRRIADMVVDSDETSHVFFQHQNQIFHAENSTGSWNTELVDENLTVGDINDVFLDENGLIHLIFFSNGPYYAYGFTGSWTVEPITPGLDHFFTIALTVDGDGLPRIAGYDYRTGQLYAIRKTQFGDWQYHTVEAGLDSGNYASIAVDSTGQSHICYFEAGNADLKYAVGIDDNWTVETVDGQDSFRGYHCDMVLNSADEPLISYMGDGLMLAEKSGSSWTVSSIAAVWANDTNIRLASQDRPHIAAGNTYFQWDGSQWLENQFCRTRASSVSMDLTQDGSPRIVFQDPAFDLHHLTPSPTAPEMVSISPNELIQGEYYPGTVITGSNLSQIRTLELDRYILVDNLQASANQVTADITVNPHAVPGYYDLGGESDDAATVLTDAVHILYGPPEITSVDPPGAPKGLDLDVMLYGLNFTETQSVDFGPGVTVNQFDVLWNERLSVSISVDAAAATGLRDVTVTSPTGTGMLPQAFDILEGYTSVWRYDVSMPDDVYAGTPFTLTLTALDYFDRHVTTYTGSASLYDEITGTLTPNSVNFTGGIGQVSAVITETAKDDRIGIYPGSRTEYTDYFDVHQAVADCDFVYPNPTLYTDSNPASLAVTDQGEVLCLMGDDTLWLRRLTGTGWTLEQIDATSGTGGGAAIALEENRYPHVVYRNKTNGDIFYGNNPGTGWYLEQIATGGYEPGIAVDSNGDPHVSYYTDEGQMYAHRQDGQWTVTMIGSIQGSCSIATDSQNRAHITTFNALNAIIHYYGYLNDVYQHVELTYGEGEFQELALDSQDHPHVVYAGLKHKFWDGAAWQTESLPDSDTYLYCHFQIDSEDRLIAAATLYPTFTESYPVIFTNSGGGWQTENFYITNERLGRHMDFIRDLAGNLHFTYKNDGPQNFEYAVKDNGVWSRDSFPVSRFTGHYPNIIFTEDEDPVLYYIGYNVSMSGSTPDLPQSFQVIRSQRKDDAWSTEVLFDYPHATGALTAVQDAAGNHHLLIIDAPYQQEPQLIHAWQTGQTWQAETVATGDFYFEGEGGQPFFALAFLPDGTPCVMYYKVDGSLSLEFAQRTGTGWVSEPILPSTLYGLSMTTDSAGTVHFVSDSDDGTGRKLYYGVGSLGSWDIQEIYPREGYQSRLLLDPAGNPHVIFGDWSVREIKHLYASGSAWTVETVDGDFPGPNWMNDAHLDAENNIHCLYAFRPTVEPTEDYDLRYAIGDPDGWHVYDIDWDGWAGNPARFALNSVGLPCIAYRDRSAEEIKYTECAIFLTPEIDAIDPPIGYPGETLPTVFITGAGLFPVTDLNFGDGIRVRNLTPLSNTTIQAEITIESGAVPGLRTVQAISPAGAGQCQDCFRIAQPGDLPQLLNMNPSRAKPGEQVQVLIQGQFLSGVTAAGVDPEISVTEIRVLSDDYLEAVITVSDQAYPGGRTLWAVNEYGRGECAGCFQVEYQGPATPGPSPTGPAPTRTPPPTATMTPTSPQNTATPSPTPTASSTAPPTVTATPTVTPTQENTPPTATPTASATAANTPATPTPTPPPSATNTPGPCTETGVQLLMPREIFTPGDVCWLKAQVCNHQGETLQGYPLFVILDVYGALFFAPSFNQVYDNYLQQYPTFDPGPTEVEVLPPFEWPQVDGELNGVLFYGALTDPDITGLVGTYDVVEFGWSS